MLSVDLQFGVELVYPPGHSNVLWVLHVHMRFGVGQAALSIGLKFGVGQVFPV